MSPEVWVFAGTTVTALCGLLGVQVSTRRRVDGGNDATASALAAIKAQLDGIDKRFYGHVTDYAAHSPSSRTALHVNRDSRTP